MAQLFLQHRLSNGLVLVAEKMRGVKSAAMTLLVPASGSNDPIDRSGSASVLSELVLRGAGSRDSRQLSDYLDTLGLQRSSSASALHTRFGCAALPPQVLEGLEAYADIVQKAHLPADGFEAAKDLAQQALAGIEDEPRQKLMIHLRQCFWPWPYGRNTMGEEKDLAALTYEETKSAYTNRYSPDGAVLAIAGDIDFDVVKARVESLFGNWKNNPIEIVKGPAKQKSSHHETQKSEQTHIGVAYPAVSEIDPDYYAARLATEVLSGGMSGRLFTEIREKKALVYSVSGSYSSVPGMGAIIGYAGTSNERAQQTLDQLIIELKRMADGVTHAELDRAKIGLKASIIMSGESTSGRAGAIAYDHIIRGRIRSMDEIIFAIDNTSLDNVNDYLKRSPAKDFTIVTVGPKELVLP